MQMLPSPPDNFSVKLASGEIGKDGRHGSEGNRGSGGFGRAAEVSPLDVALRHKWLILGSATLIAGLLYIVLGFVTPRYSAEADIRIDIPQLRYAADSASVIPSEQVSAEALHTEMAAFGSPRLAEQAAVSLGLQNRRDYQLCPKLSVFAGIAESLRTTFGLAPAAHCQVSVTQAGKVLLDRVTVGNDKLSYIIQVRASDSTAEGAARIANGFAAAYINYQRDRKAALAQEADSWLSSQLAMVKGAMEKADRAVEAYRQAHSLVSLHSDVPGVPDTATGRHLAELSREQDEVEGELTQKETTLNQMRGALAAGAASSAASALDSIVVQTLLEKHGELAANLSQLRATLGPEHPSVLAAEAALRRNEAQTGAEIARSESALGGQVAALRARRAALAAEVSRATQKVSGESQDRVGLEELQREAATERTLYESLFVRLKQVDAERRLAIANAAIVVEAMPPDRPVFPHRLLMSAGAFLAAIGAGIGGSVLFEIASGKFQDAGQLEGEIGLPVLGLFLRYRGAPHDMVVDEPYSIETEAVHATLTQILRHPLADPARPGRTILVTSSLPNEGKSSFCVALGRAAALAGHSVLLLDCDLRRPSIARLLWAAGAAVRRDRMAVPSGPNGTGLIDMVSTDLKTSMRYLTLSSFYDKPRGLPGWAPFSDLWQQAQQHFDIVLIDTPPVLATAEAAELGGYADDVVLMVAMQETPREAASEAVRVLRRAGIALRGTVLSKVDLRRQAERGSLYFKAHAAYAKPIPFNPDTKA
jgi:uncharacterized protein involved in exopolysaccharide biosynthesis/Mrp family chromosome partitioning ATPase